MPKCYALESRHFNDHTGWMLDPDVYGSVVSEFGTPTIDLFACRLNKQCPVYASWRPYNDATFVDAFSANWKNVFFYVLLLLVLLEGPRKRFKQTGQRESW